jgi:hypothetical protein
MRPYGYTTNLRTEVTDTEADRIRAAADEVLDDDKNMSLTDIAEEWNLRGYATVTGRPWTPSTLRRILLNPHNAGLLEDGVTPAPWPAILTPQTHRRLVEKLDGPERGTGGQHADRVYLLTGGYACCGLCTVQLLSNPVKPGQRSYVCSSTKRTGGCGKIRINGEALDDYVSLHLLAHVGADIEAGGGTSAAHRQLQEHALTAHENAAAAQIAAQGLAQDYAAGIISKDAYVRVATEADRLAEEAGELGRLAAVRLPQTVHELTAWWNGASVAQRRPIMEVFIEAVEVHPALKKGNNVFDERRVKIRWR